MFRNQAITAVLRVVMSTVVLTVLMALSIASYLHGPSGSNTSAVMSVSMTVVQRAAEDSSSVVHFSAVLYDAGTNAVLDSVASGASDTVIFKNVSTTGVETPSTGVPRAYDLEQNFPNPFNPSTIIRFGIARTENVSLIVYDILGRKIATLVDQMLAVGRYQVAWNPNVASGVYFYRLQAGSYSETKKMIALDGSGHAAASNRIELLGAANGGAAGTESRQLRKSQTGGYTLRVFSSSGGTVPQVYDQTIPIPSVSTDTTITLYVRRIGAHVYSDSTQQLIEGFGGANVFIFGRPDMTAAEVQTAYGQGEGQIGMSIMRVSIPPDSTQFGAYVSSAHLAESLGAKVIATPWTPPPWMKTNNDFARGSLAAGHYADYASYLKSFADTMASHGAPVYAISVQNEPDANVTYQSCYWTATQFMTFMRYNAPAVGVPVFMPESENFNHTFSDSTLNDSLAASHVAFVGGHIYGATPSKYSLAISKGKELWMTEYLINGTSGGVNLDTTWTGALRTAKSIHDCMNASMSAYVWWYTLRYYGPIDDGTLGGVAGSVTKKGYVMSQYARFVRPGYHRVAVDAALQANVYVTAYRNGNSVVIVALNMGTTPLNQTFVIPKGGPTSYAAYVTSATQNCTLQNVYDVSSLTFTAPLDASSVTTFVSN